MIYRKINDDEVSFENFINKYKLGNKATPNLNIYQVFTSLYPNHVEIYLRDGPFASDIGIVNLHPSKGPHWVVYYNETYFAVVVVHLLEN